MNLIFDDSGAAFGIFLFLAIAVTAAISFLVISPYVEGINNAFDQTYKDDYLSADGQETVTLLKFMFDHILVLFIVIVSAIMVINRAVYHGDSQ
ncbi:MAG: hypothetical protein P1P69_04120 [Methanosarcinaceae archaeon]|nr:hypothetical protein [Methanosarcinaceae archaeon]